MYLPCSLKLNAQLELGTERSRSVILSSTSPFHTLSTTMTHSRLPPCKLPDTTSPWNTASFSARFVLGVPIVAHIQAEATDALRIRRATTPVNCMSFFIVPPRE